MCDHTECEYGALVGGECGSSARYLSTEYPSEYLTIRECNRSIERHITQTLQASFANHGLNTEAELLLARAGKFETWLYMLSTSINLEGIGNRNSSFHRHYHFLPRCIEFDVSKFQMTICLKHRNEFGIGLSCRQMVCKVPLALAPHHVRKRRRKERTLSFA